MPHFLVSTPALTTAAVLCAVAMAATARRCLTSLMQRAFIAGLAAGGVQKLTGTRSGFLCGFAAGAALGATAGPIVKAVAPLLKPGRALALEDQRGKA